MRSIYSRLEKVENTAKDRLGRGAVLVITDLAAYENAGGDIRKLGGAPIPGKESIVIIDDIPGE